MTGKADADPGAQIRDARAAEAGGLAEIWWQGWQDAHSAILPHELARLRTLESFHERISANLHNVRVAGPQGAPLGFAMLKADELDQLYVAADARGTGVAGALMVDSFARLRAAGAKVAWLACAIGNDRAARFYEKWGWRNAGTMVSNLPTPEGIFSLKVWRFEIDLCDRHP